MTVVQVSYFSDVLCIWAYATQIRIDAVKEKFGDTVRLDYRFCSVFGDVAGKINSTWRDKGGYEGFASHLHEVARQFSHIEVNPKIWKATRPPTSASPHLFLRAVQQWEQGLEVAGHSAPQITIFEKLLWAFRCAFFRECRDIARWDVQCDLAKGHGVDTQAIENSIRNGTAFAGLARDYQDADKMRIEGSPTFLLNEGRQKLYGNIGFRVIEANIRELLRLPGGDEASWL